MSVKLIPINFKGYELPKFKESKKGDWYEYGSERPYKNCYGDYLVKLLNESSKQSTIIDAKTKFIVGKGFVVDGNTTFTEKAMIEGFLRTPGDDGNIEDLLAKVVKDKKVFGGFALQIRINSNGKIAAVDHLEFNDVRVGIEEGEYFYTSDWKARNPQDNEDFAKLKLFSFDNEVDTETNYIIYFKEYRPDLGEYPMPDYIAAVPYLEADAEIANFTIQNIRNGLSTGYIISFNGGRPSEEEQMEIEQRFKSYATGTDNAGKPLLSFTDQEADHPQIIPIPIDGRNDQFLNLNNQITQEIYTAHGVTSPMLFGIKDQTGLGNNADELRTAAELYQNIHIDGEQQILEDLFNEIINYNGLPKVLKIQKIEPVQKALDQSVIVSVMTQDEIREKAGLPPLEPTQRVTMDDQIDDMIFSQLESLGFNENDYEVLEIKHNEITCIEDAENFEKQMLSNYNFALDRVLSDAEKAVLSMLVETPTMPNTEIAEAMEISIQETNEIIQELQNIGALDVNFEPTESGKSSIQKPTEEIFVAYKYIERPDALPLKGGKSRPFCVKMLSFAKAGRIYTLDQLKLLRNDFNQTGIDIFVKRGGWYTVPDTNIRRPFCRHIWQQEVIRKKR
tara:strand:+ start:695 stop:2551 length:1857 start_codon:yes stop_codon:yes gene_type:complete